MEKPMIEKEQCLECEQIINPNKRNSWGHNILVAFDQLGNAFANGNPDTTISSRVGYYANYNTSKPSNPKFWKMAEKMIDFAWWPYERENHCRDSYDADPEIPYPGNVVARTILFIEALVFSIVVSFFLYFSWLLFPSIRKRYKCQECRQIVRTGLKK